MAAKMTDEDLPRKQRCLCASSTFPSEAAIRGKCVGIVINRFQTFHCRPSCGCGDVLPNPMLVRSAAHATSASTERVLEKVYAYRGEPEMSHQLKNESSMKEIIFSFLFHQAP